MGIEKKISQAIRAQNPIECRYHGKKRFIEPHHFGILGGENQLHCYQYDGESESGGIPEWRNLKLNEIQALRVMTDIHFVIRPSYHPENAHYTTIEQSVFENDKK